MKGCSERGFALIFIILIFIQFGYSQPDSIAKFTDYKKIYGFGSANDDRFLKVDSFSINWGSKVLADLNLKNLKPFEKALIIKNYQ